MASISFCDSGGDTIGCEIGAIGPRKVDAGPNICLDLLVIYIDCHICKALIINSD